MSKVCGDCKHWKQTQTPKVGFCKRFPPTIGNHGEGTWPTTHTDDWCGEWEITDEARKQIIREITNDDELCMGYNCGRG